MVDVMAKMGAALLSLPVQRYITTNRDRLCGRSRRLSRKEKCALDSHFKAAELERVRIVIADPLPISEPPFAAVVHRLGFDFPSVALTAAIAFDDVIAARGQMSPALLFHELVHVTQYRLLGMREFARRYVLGFLVARSYIEIPLEKIAFDLEARFSAGDIFDVETEVASTLKVF